MELIQIDEKTIVKLIKVRSKDAHKGTCGKVIHITGSECYSGACVIAAKASMKSGTGMLYVCSKKEVNDVVRNHVLEAILILRDSFDVSTLKDKDACLIGSGLGLNDESYEITKHYLENTDIPTVIDGDALTILSKHPELFTNKPFVLTPHYGEFKRLFPQFNPKDAPLQVKDFALKHHCILVLKGPGTLISDGIHVYQNTTGNEAMASAGMGDVLAGMISSYLGQGYTPLEAAIMGVYIHGLCGDRLAKDNYSIMASVLCDEIPHITRELVNKK